MKKLFTIIIVSFTTVFADTITTTVPAMMSVLPNKVILGIDYFTRQSPSVEFTGNIKAAGTTYKNQDFSSSGQTSYDTLFYAISDWQDNYRFAFVAKPLFADDISTTQSSPLAQASLATYSVDFMSYSFSVCRKIDDNFYFALTANVVNQKVSQSYNWQNTYNMNLQGSGMSPSIGASFAYLNSSGFNIFTSFTSQNNITLKGGANGTYLGRQVYSAISLDNPLPAEAIIGAQQFFNKEYGIQASVKKRWWSAYKVQDLHFENQTLENVFGKPVSINDKDTINANILLFYNGQILNVLIGAGAYTVLNNPNYASLTTIGFGGKYSFASLAYKINQNLSVGTNFVHTWLNGSNISSQSLQGYMHPSTSNIIGLFTKVEF